MPKFALDWTIRGKVKVDADCLEMAKQKVLDDFNTDDLLSQSTEESLEISADSPDEFEAVEE